jgi:hypothetical protein
VASFGWWWFALMDKVGIDFQVLSTPPVSPHFADEAQAARWVNDEYAELAARHPGSVSRLRNPAVPAHRRRTWPS